VRQHGQRSDSLSVFFVVDDVGILQGEIEVGDLLLAPLDGTVADFLESNLVVLRPNQDQEEAVTLFRTHGRAVPPVVDSAGILIGIVTIDDALDVAQDEATEDIQKLGAVEGLDSPYLKAPLGDLIRSRATWLVLLFLSETLTASAMAFFESEIDKAVVLALFVPLIISSGGNAGSQAATLIIRAMSIGEIRMKDWWRVFQRELASGAVLGILLGFIGFLRIGVWSLFFDTYGPHWLLIGTTILVSLLTVVLWGTLVGAMLPFALRRMGADPATSSAPFVATLVDVVGLVLYFTVAAMLLRGTLL
jgi:magnesium transporter